MHLHLEALEDRQLLTVFSSLSGNVLNLTALAGLPHNVLVRPTANVPNSIDVLADGASQSFTGVATVNYSETPGPLPFFRSSTTFTNRTTLAGTLTFGDGNNVVYTIAPGSRVQTGQGNNVLQVTGGNSTISAGNGNNSVYGGPGDVIQVGAGVNVVYDILPGTQTITVAPHTGIDHLFVGPQSTLKGALPQDHVATFFVTAPLGSGKLAVNNNTLYYAASNAGDLFLVNQFGSQIFVTYGPQGNVNTQVFAAGSFNQIAAFGGSGNDLFVNNTNIDDVQYGAGGVNFIEGGTGAFTLIKTGGTAAGGSVAIARSPVYNDINGSGNTTAANVLIFQGGSQAQNIVRTNSPSDVIIGFKATDTLVSLYPDQIVAAFLPPFVPA